MKQVLEAASCPWEICEPVREDFGAVLLFSRDKATFTVTVSWQGGYMWALVFDQQRGCLGWLFSRKAEAEPLAEIEFLRHGVMFNDAIRFLNPCWILNEGFPGVASSFVIPKD